MMMVMKKVEERRPASQPSPGLTPAPAADMHWGALGWTGQPWSPLLET